MQLFWFVVGIMAAWRVTHLLNGEDGPWKISVRLRRSAGNSVLGEMLDCFYCLSLWVAVPFALFLGQDWAERILIWPALSAGAILLETSIGAKSPVDASHADTAAHSDEQEP